MKRCAVRTESGLVLVASVVERRKALDAKPDGAPNDAALLGLMVFLQGFVLDRQANTVGHRLPKQVIAGCQESIPYG